MPQTKTAQHGLTTWEDFALPEEVENEKLRSLSGLEERAAIAVRHKLREAEDSTISELTFCLGELYNILTQHPTIPASSYELVLRDILVQVWKEADARSMARCIGTEQNSPHYPIALARNTDARSACPKCTEYGPQNTGLEQPGQELSRPPAQR